MTFYAVNFTTLENSVSRPKLEYNSETSSARVQSNLTTVYHLVVAEPDQNGVLVPITFSAFSAVEGISVSDTTNSPTNKALAIVDYLNEKLANRFGLSPQPFYLGKYDPDTEPGAVPEFVFCDENDESCLSEYPDIIVTMASFPTEIIALNAIQEINALINQGRSQ
jgi:hypothetical protein